MRVFNLKFRDPRSSPERLIECTLQIVRYEWRTAQWARSLIVPHPTVQTTSVEDVGAVREPSDLVVILKLAQAHGAAVGRVHHLREPHHRQDFTDQELRHGLEFRYAGIRVGPGNVGFEEVVEAQEAEEVANQSPDEAQYGEDLKNQLWEEKFCVTHWEPHIACTQKNTAQ